MTRKEQLIAAIIVLLIVGVAVLEAMAPKPTDWSPSFSQYHDKPFGARLLYDRLGDLFDEVVPVRATIYETSEDRLSTWWEEEQPAAHVFLSDAFRPEGPDLRALLRLLDAGDHVFMAAEWFGQELLDTLGCATNTSDLSWRDTTDLRFERGPLADTTFSFSRMAGVHHFDDMDTLRSTVLCRTKSGEATMLHVRVGEGHAYLCTTPLAFTNYHLLRNNNNDFIEAAFGWLPPEKLYWDEFHKVGREGSLTPLRYILDQRALRWAYYLILLLILVYMFIQAKREQRAIPIVEPLKNSSREFVGTLGRLYFEKGDHADLARKMIAHFKEDVRTRAYLRGFEYDERTINHLARRAGLEPTAVAEQLRHIQRIEQQNTTSEAQLLDLSDRLQALRNRL